MEQICQIAKRYKLKLIEDCAQSAGAEYDKKKVGTFGDIATFSFYATKNMTTGEGGMVVTNNRRLMDRCKSLVNHGRSSRFVHSRLGYNYRMTEIVASLGLGQLKRLNLFNKKRIQNASFLTKNLSGLRKLKLPIVPPRCKHVFHLYTLRVKKGRASFIKHLDKNGVESAIIYPFPLHRQPVYKNFGISGNNLPTAEQLSRQVVSIPVHPELSQGELGKMVRVITEWDSLSLKV